LPFFEEIGQKRTKKGHFETVCFKLCKNRPYSVISPSTVFLNFAVSLNVSSTILRLPPVNFGLMFSITIFPSCFPPRTGLAKASPPLMFTVAFIVRGNVSHLPVYAAKRGATIWLP